MFSEDYDSFLDTDEGAVEAVIGASTFNVRLIKRYVEVETGQASYSGVKPTVFGKHSDLTGNNGATITIDGSDYTIVDIQPDESGMAVAILEDA